MLYPNEDTLETVIPFDGIAEIPDFDGSGNEIEYFYSDDISAPCFSCSPAADQPVEIQFPTFEPEFDYDIMGRKINQTDRPLGTSTEEYVTKFEYDAGGNLIKQTDPELKETIYEYDSLNRMVRTIDATGEDTVYGYDDRGNLRRLQDADENVTQFTYYLNNRLFEEIRPSGVRTEYYYDNAGNLDYQIDAKGQKIDYDYDKNGRLTKTEYFDTDNALARTITYGYKDNNRPGNYLDTDESNINGPVNLSRADYTYDYAGRKNEEKVTYHPGVNGEEFQLSYSYTYYDNNMKETFTGPDGIVYSYHYDGANKLADIRYAKASATPISLYTVNSYTWNRPENITLMGGTQRQFTYDELMRVETINSTSLAGNSIMDYSYPARDKVGNITQKLTDQGTYQYDYTYDDLYRLTDATNPALEQPEKYSYDPVGNRLRSEDTTSEWGYNINNELTGFDNVSYAYDKNGNMIQKTIGSLKVKYNYNIANRLVEVTNADGTEVFAIYYYDPFGRRLWKKVGTGERTYYLYSDEGLIGEYTYNQVSGTAEEIKTYGYKPNSTWTTDPIFIKQDSNSDAIDEYYFFHNDHLGTPQKLTDINGAVVWSAKYTAFGKAVVEVETVENNLRFAGQYYDDETGLHYNWNRYYDPGIGRYLRTDPIGFSGGVNLYLYAIGNPVNGIDELGLMGRRPNKYEEKGYEYGDFCFSQLGSTLANKRKLCSHDPFNEMDCYTCCADLILNNPLGPAFPTEYQSIAVGICESKCIDGIKKLKKKKCCK